MKAYKSNIDQVWLGRTPSDVKKAKISTSKDASEYLRPLYNPATLEYNETFIALYMNRANVTIAWQLVSQGGLNGTVVDVRMIVKAALDSGASTIILSHNHPSGNTKPSTADLNITKRVAEAAKFFDLAVLDHTIVTSESYHSIQDNEGI
jgi:DNA repair protein RadC